MFAGGVQEINYTLDYDFGIATVFTADYRGSAFTVAISSNTENFFYYGYGLATYPARCNLYNDIWNKKLKIIIPNSDLNPEGVSNLLFSQVKLYKINKF